MKRSRQSALRVLVIDVGGSHIKCVASQHPSPVRFKSGPELSPDKMIEKLSPLIKGWRYEAVSMGYPGVVRGGKIVREPQNLGAGWVDFDFEKAFGRPVKILNDAAMQALGSYQGGSMLFLGLGTGLGTALIVDDTIVPMELAHLRYAGNRTYEDLLGDRARKRRGRKKWNALVDTVVQDLRHAFLPDEVVLGGGNVARLKTLPPQTRCGANTDAFKGGFRLWQVRAPTIRTPAKK